MAAGLQTGGGTRIDFESETFIHVSPPLTTGTSSSGGGRRPGMAADDVEALIVSDPLTANEGSTYTHEGKGNFRLRNVVEHPVAFKASHYTRDKDGAPSEIAPPLSADADKGDQDTLVLAHEPLPFDVRQITSKGNRSNPQHGDPCPTLPANSASEAPMIAFSCKDSGHDAGDQAPTLRAMSEGDGNANAGGQIAVVIPINADALRGEGTAKTPGPDAEGRVRLRDPGLGVGAEGDPAGTLAAAGPGAVAFQSRFARNGRGAPEEVCQPLCAQSGESGKGDAAPLTMIGMQVRRLTPVECERLQGFPDGWTAITFRGKPAADGPRYKALGNSMAIPVMAWIGRRIDLVESVIRSLEESVA